MRFLTLFLALAIGLAACNGKSSSNSSDQSNAAASPAATASEMASSAATEAAGGGEVPSYPGAQTQASGSNSNASGTVMTTDDSFDKVYTWYQQHMPTGSEKTHTTMPVNSAVFMIGEPGQNQTSVTITTSAGKTMITVAKVNS